jgi:hypothetical protein
MMAFNRVIVLGITFSLIVLNTPIRAVRRCGCGAIPADYHARWVKTEFDRAVAVFSGEVVKENIVTATFKIAHVWKGKLGPEVTLSTGAQVTNGIATVSTCDWTYEKGRRYLIFTYGTSLADMKASQCTPTIELEHADRTLAVLREITGGGFQPLRYESARIRERASYVTQAIEIC